eukprot:m.183384 g.183384  ORF g.183384 m.183384 type:complete len:68 (+) comp14993_c0_seq15:3351-3554(+)
MRADFSLIDRPRRPIHGILVVRQSGQKNFTLRGKNTLVHFNVAVEFTVDLASTPQYDTNGDTHRDLS